MTITPGAAGRDRVEFQLRRACPLAARENYVSRYRTRVRRVRTIGSGRKRRSAVGDRERLVVAAQRHEDDRCHGSRGGAERGADRPTPMRIAWKWDVRPTA